MIPTGNSSTTTLSSANIPTRSAVQDSQGSNEVKVKIFEIFQKMTLLENSIDENKRNSKKLPGEITSINNRLTDLNLTKDIALNLFRTKVQKIKEISSLKDEEKQLLEQLEVVEKEFYKKKKSLYENTLKNIRSLKNDLDSKLQEMTSLEKQLTEINQEIIKTNDELKFLELKSSAECINTKLKINKEWLKCTKETIDVLEEDTSLFKPEMLKQIKGDQLNALKEKSLVISVDHIIEVEKQLIISMKEIPQSPCNYVIVTDCELYSAKIGYKLKLFLLAFPVTSKNTLQSPYSQGFIQSEDIARAWYAKEIFCRWKRADLEVKFYYKTPLGFKSFKNL